MKTRSLLTPEQIREHRETFERGAEKLFAQTGRRPAMPDWMKGDDDHDVSSEDGMMANERFFLGPVVPLRKVQR